MSERPAAPSAGAPAGAPPERFLGARELFRRERRPGDLVFAVLFLILAAFLAYRLPDQVLWPPGRPLVGQPAFWPAVSVGAMLVFASLHWLGSVCSPRIPGRWTEVGFWCRSVEYALWFLAYVLVMPTLGYLPTSVAVAVLLTLRLGYRGGRPPLAAALVAAGIVVMFRGVLQVKVPSGALYEYLPGALRGFARIYL